MSINPNFYLFLDDLRDPSYLRREYPTVRLGRGGVVIPSPEEFLVARSVPEAKELIKNLGYPAVVALDHDLGEDTPDGYEFVKWLVEEDLDNNWMEPSFIYVVHSMNPVGAMNMFNYLDSYYYNKLKDRKE